MCKLFPYIFLNGRTAEALEFYAQALEGTAEYVLPYDESPLDTPEHQNGQIMHAAFTFWGGTLMFSDPMEGPQSEVSNIQLSLEFDVPEHQKRTFAALAEGGQVTMEL